MVERKLATIRRISNIEPIPEADVIELATVDGWKVVVKKGDFEVDEYAIYVEIDSWIPHEIAPFLSRGEPREYMGVKGERLRTVKLRGQLSQGLLLPLSTVSMIDKHAIEGDDVTDWLGIIKYEKPVPACLSGVAKGNFPSFIPKTDEERVQNLSSDLHLWADHKWEVTEKLDGSSMTVYWKDGEFGVCSHNLDLKKDENNTFWRTALSESLHIFLSDELGNIAIQGELIGEGIQGNKYKLKGHKFMVFNIYDIDSGQYMESHDRHRFCDQLGLSEVPVLDLDISDSFNLETILKIANGDSYLAGNREGIVFKSQTDTSIHFKAISNRWLLKNE